MANVSLADSNTRSVNPSDPRGQTAANSHHHHDHGHDGRDQEDNHDHGEGWIEWARVGFVALILVLDWLQAVPRVSGIDVLALVGVLIGGYPIFKEAISDLLERRMTMEISMTIALVAASAIGEFFTALLITVFVLIAEILEGMTVGRGRRAIRELLDLLPQMAEVRLAEQFVARSLSEVQLGNVVLVRPGGRIPVDGVVVSRFSFVDQATITGESLPVEKISGTPVFAGTINQSGVLEIRAEKLGRDTAFGRIIEAVERAERSRAPIQRTADRLAGYLLYFALSCAALTFGITRDARSTISVIVVAGACGIAAGTPLAILGAIGRAARMGAIVKGGLHLEVLSSVDTIVLDKTGTLTLGSPQISDIRVYNGFNSKGVIRIAATAERFSEHPLAKAIVKKAHEWSLPVGNRTGFQYLPAKASCARWKAGELWSAQGTCWKRRAYRFRKMEPDPSASRKSWSPPAARFWGRSESRTSCAARQMQQSRR